MQHGSIIEDPDAIQMDVSNPSAPLTSPRRKQVFNCRDEDLVSKPKSTSKLTKHTSREFLWMKDPEEARTLDEKEKILKAIKSHRDRERKWDNQKVLEAEIKRLKAVNQQQQQRIEYLEESEAMTKNVLQQQIDLLKFENAQLRRK